MSYLLRHLPCIVLLAALLSACAAPARESARQRPVDLPEMRTIPAGETAAEAITAEARQRIADLLFAGLQALDRDQLLVPQSDNAYDHFREVLRLQPGNELALQGLQGIFERYLALAREAANRGDFGNAERMLNRAEIIDGSHPGIATARQALAAERNSGDLFFPLDEAALRQRTAAIERTLIDIASQARQAQALVHITAPDDELARWIYGVMRNSTPGYRLRANIEIASGVLLRLRMPKP